MSNNNKPLMDPNEVSDYIGVKPGTLALWRSKGLHPELKYVKTGHRVRYRRSAVESWLESRTVGTRSIDATEPEEKTIVLEGITYRLVPVE